MHEQFGSEHQDDPELQQQLDELQKQLAACHCESEALRKQLSLLRHSSDGICRAKRQWELAVDATDDLIFLHDADGTIIRANRAYADKAGCTPSELINRDFRTLFPLGLSGDMQPLVAMAEGVKRMILLENGESYHCSLFPVRDGDKTIYVHVLRDLTEFQRTQQELAESRNVVLESLKGIIRGISAVSQVRDPYTSGHQRRVANLAAGICQVMGKRDGFVEGIRIAAYVHDIGKVGVPAELLAKPGSFNEIEYAYVQQHCEIGYRIFEGIRLPWPVAEVVLQHHERIDGSGYPNGLRYDQIAPEARVVAVADVVEAISSHRPYRPALGTGMALDEVSRGRGEKYDADVVDACLKLFGRGYQIID